MIFIELFFIYVNLNEIKKNNIKMMNDISFVSAYLIGGGTGLDNEEDGGESSDDLEIASSSDSDINNSQDSQGSFLNFDLIHESDDHEIQLYRAPVTISDQLILDHEKLFAFKIKNGIVQKLQSIYDERRVPREVASE